MKTKSYISSNPDSDFSIKKNNSEVIMNKNRLSSQRKPRSCGACKTSINDGEDMYRFYKTNLTVCKTCWTSMYPNKCKTKLKKLAGADTKLCAVFLKDVLSDVTAKEHKGYKVEKDKYGNNVYVITDSESEADPEDKMDTDSSQSQKKLSKETDNKPKRTRKRSIIHRSECSDCETKTIKRMKHDKETTSKISKLEGTVHTKNKSTKRDHYSDTDILLHKEVQVNAPVKMVKKNNRKVYSLSDIDTNKSQKKKQNVSLKNLKSLKSLRESTTSDDSSLTEDSTKVKNSNEQSKSHANNNITGKRKKKSSLSSTSSSDSTLLPKIQNSEPKRIRKTFVPKSKKKSVEETSSDNTDLDEMDSKEKVKHICHECNIMFKNKLELVTHELTHFKTLELKLHKLRIEDKYKDNGKVDKLNVNKLNDELNEQQNEEITLSVHDDEESEVADITDRIDVMEDTIEKSDEDIKSSLTENKEKDSLEMHMTGKEVEKKSELVETIKELISNDSIKVNEDKDRTSESTEQNRLMLTNAENNNTSKDIGNDQNQSDGTNNDRIEDIEQSTKEMDEVNEEIEDKDKEKINEKVEGDKNENIEQHGDDTKDKEKDKIEEVEEDNDIKEKDDTTMKKENEAEDKQDNTMEIENNKNEKVNDVNERENHTNEIKGDANEIEDNANEIEDDANDIENDMDVTKDIMKEIMDITMERENEMNKRADTTNEMENGEANKTDDTMKEKVDGFEENENKKMKEIEMSNAEREKQNSDINSFSEDINSNNSILNDNIHLADVIENLDVENEKSSVDNKDEKNEMDNGIIDDTSLEGCNIASENNIPTFDTKSINDNSISFQETIDKQVDITHIIHSEEQKLCTTDTQKLLSDLSTMSEPATCIEVSLINKNNKESVNAVVEMDDHVFDLVTNEQQNHLSTVEHDIRCKQLRPETLEDISREIQKSADMPSLDPINSMEMDFTGVSIN